MPAVTTIKTCFCVLHDLILQLNADFTVGVQVYTLRSAIPGSYLGKKRLVSNRMINVGLIAQGCLSRTTSCSRGSQTRARIDAALTLATGEVYDSFLGRLA